MPEPSRVDHSTQAADVRAPEVGHHYPLVAVTVRSGRAVTATGG